MNRVIKYLAFLMPVVFFSCSNPVITLDATEVESGSAILNGDLLKRFPLSRWDIGFVYSTNPNPTIDNGIKVIYGGFVGGLKYNAKVKGLTASTTYYYRALVSGKSSYKYGEIKSFTTQPFKISAVDMGLSVKWGNANIGANAIDDYGKYYSWGEIEDKEKYSLDTYKWKDNKIRLDKADDVAHVRLGGRWRIPSEAEWDELRNNCSGLWTTINETTGLLVTSNKNGNSIFLPASGYLNDMGVHGYQYKYLNGNMHDVGEGCHFWTSSIYKSVPGYAIHACCHRRSILLGEEFKYVGMSIRPVLE